ncbi:heptosyltransferase [Caulobacter sp. Root1455]|uniref:glycosyltransferase family 9 protein n=1 Tax=unclassified Caulobacter TaxID=2648921 RepID=UPI0006F9957B|nr:MULTISPECIES: glycosyltransferase family 9 protein [unclassified Caulobacter]KQY26087.1 heptosyltransferase [Caulobacter sp. Root487D2Y]KQZ04022.1 heptosyltransferase [Caulobacter sp. Root1455]
MVQTILIYSMGEVIGDGLIKLPFIAGLRAAFPEARITWCAAKGETVYAGPLRAVVAGYIDEVLTDGPTGDAALDVLPWVKPFGGRTFDLVIDTQENLRRSLVARRAAPKDGKGRGFVSAAAQARQPDWPVAVVERLARLLALATEGNGAPRPLTLTNPDAAAAARALLPAEGDGPAYVGLAPGAGGQDKRWPLERYLDLARRIEASGRKAVFFFGPDEAADARTAREAVPTALFPEKDRTDGFTEVKGPLLAIALAGRLTAAVANDAGPGHMLAAGGAPLLSLQKDHRKAVKFRPAARRLELLVAEDYGQGMAALPLDVVDAALQHLIAGAS